MGFWGADLYQNDTSLDVKEQFEELLRKNKSVEEITLGLIQEYEGVNTEIQEMCAFWLALADTQWNWGVLLPYVKEQALSLLEKGGDIECWKNVNKFVQLQRKRVLYDLEQNLLSPQPPARKPIKKRVYKCEWKIGDVFAYQLQSDLAKEKGLLGRYLLIRKIDESIWHPGHIVPIVYVKITKDDKLPTTLEEYDKLEYIQTSFTKYEDRFLPLDGRRIQEDIAEKSQIVYEIDDFGFLPQFRAILLNTSRKVIPSDLLFIGNFCNAIPPKKEFIPHSKLNIKTVSWKCFEDTFESVMLELYCGHNLRKFSIYSKERQSTYEKSFTEIMINLLEKS